MWPSNFTPTYIPKRNEYMHSHKNLYTNVHSSIIHNSQKVEIVQMSTNGCTDPQNVVSQYGGILLRHQKEWGTYIPQYNMDDPWKHHAEWKKPDTKDHILYDPILWTVQNRQIHRDRKISGCQRLWRGRNLKWLLSGTKFFLGGEGDKNVLKLDSGDGCTLYNLEYITCEYTRKRWIVHFRWVNFMVCELYVNKDVIFKKGTRMFSIYWQRKFSTTMALCESKMQNSVYKTLPSA